MKRYTCMYDITSTTNNIGIIMITKITTQPNTITQICDYDITQQYYTNM